MLAKKHWLTRSGILGNLLLAHGLLLFGLSAPRALAGSVEEHIVAPGSSDPITLFESAGFAQGDNTNGFSTLAGCPASGGIVNCGEPDIFGSHATGLLDDSIRAAQENLDLDLGAVAQNGVTDAQAAMTKPSVMAPEPEVLVLFGSGLISLSLACRRWLQRGNSGWSGRAQLEPRSTSSKLSFEMPACEKNFL
jgi:hypothetical protein